MIMGKEVAQVSLGGRRQRRHRHPPATARPEPRDDAGAGRGRRARRAVRGRPGRLRRHRRHARSRWSAPAGAAPRRWPTARCSTASRAAARARSSPSPRTCSRRAPTTSRSASGVISVQGTPSVAAPDWPSWPGSWREEPERLPEGADTELDGDAGVRRRPERLVGRHARLPRSRSTSRPDSSTIERYVVVEDCGLPVNPAIVEGQIRGGVAQGIGAVLLEHVGVRRGRPVPGVDVHGLPDADDDRRAELRDPPRRDRPDRSGRELPRRRRRRDDRRARVHHERDRGRARDRSACRCASNTSLRLGSSALTGVVPE